MRPFPGNYASAPLQRGPAQFQGQAHMARPKAPQLLQREHHHRFGLNSFALVSAAPGMEAFCARVSST